LIAENTIYCANAGDSRCIISNNGKAEELSKDHKPKNEKEKERIEKAGGYVHEGRINGNLSVSRAIGDFEYKNNANLPKD